MAESPTSERPGSTITLKFLAFIFITFSPISCARSRGVGYLIVGCVSHAVGSSAIKIILNLLILL